MRWNEFRKPAGLFVQLPSIPTRYLSTPQAFSWRIKHLLTTGDFSQFTHVFLTIECINLDFNSRGTALHSRCFFFAFSIFWIRLSSLGVVAVVQKTYQATAWVVVVVVAGLGNITIFLLLESFFLAFALC